MSSSWNGGWSDAPQRRKRRFTMPPLAAPGDRAAPFSSVGVFLRYILFAASRDVARFKSFIPTDSHLQAF
jgi:hypothetical protein